jgi:hypothetical protein
MRHPGLGYCADGTGWGAGGRGGFAEPRLGGAVDFAMEEVAEEMAAEFPSASRTTVIRVVSDCVAQFPDDGPLFIEQAARARLSNET